MLALFGAQGKMKAPEFGIKTRFIAALRECENANTNGTAVRIPFLWRNLYAIPFRRNSILMREGGRAGPNASGVRVGGEWLYSTPVPCFARLLRLGRWLRT
jgi:hypothetical protein